MRNPRHQSKASIRREDVSFRILDMLEKDPGVSQRQLADAVGISLGGVNYCLKALIAKGHVKIANFKASSNKLGYVYVLTPDGIGQRARLAVSFLRRKLVEYEAIRAEIEALQQVVDGSARRQSE